MPKRRGKPKLSQNITISLLAAAILSILILGLLWIKSEYEAFKTDASALEADYLAGQKEHLKTEVDKILSYIDYQRTRLAPQLRHDLRARVHEASPFKVVLLFFPFRNDSGGRHMGVVFTWFALRPWFFRPSRMLFESR